MQEIEIIICKNCNKKFEVEPYRKNTAKYCSMFCYEKKRKPPIGGHLYRVGSTPWNKGNGENKNCVICNKIFYTPNSLNRVKCCSRLCGYKLRNFEGKRNPAWKGGYPKCEICSLILTQRNYKRCSRHRNIHRTGKNNNNWKGGITPLNFKIRSSPEYKEWRKKVFERDNYTCKICGSHSGNGHAIRLEADHIKSFSRYSELRFELSNGRTLCHNCHKLTDNFAGRAIYA